MNRCEDYPCCGHEAGDCDGSLYGTEEQIRSEVQQAWDDGHGYCDHPNGIYQCAYDPDEEDDDEDDYEDGEDHLVSVEDVPDDLMEVSW